MLVSPHEKMSQMFPFGLILKIQFLG